MAWLYHFHVIRPRNSQKFTTFIQSRRTKNGPWNPTTRLLGNKIWKVLWRGGQAQMHQVSTEFLTHHPPSSPRPLTVFVFFLSPFLRAMLSKGRAMPVSIFFSRIYPVLYQFHIPRRLRLSWLHCTQGLVNSNHPVHSKFHFAIYFLEFSEPNS